MKTNRERSDEFLPRSDELIAATGGQPLSYSGWPNFQKSL